MSFAGRKVVALLPIKASSERVAGKNFREFGGKPLFRWVLDTLLSMKVIDEIVINTDARLILRAKGLGESTRVRIRDRRPDLCGDLVTANVLLADDVQAVPADIYVMTHATNPLLNAGTILGALETFLAAHEKGQADSLFSVTRCQTRFYRRDGSAVNHDPANLIRTQDLEPWYEENSNLYVFTRESFARSCGRIGSAPIMYETPRVEAVDIDDQAGWDLAELLCKGTRAA